MKKNSKIYIAGHRGLVGSAILRRLATGGYDNLVTRSHDELDLSSQAEVESFFKSERPEYVFLAAAKVGGIWANHTRPAEFIHENLAIQTNVIHEAYRSGVKNLLFLGSSCIYPRDCPQPIKEEFLLTGPLEATNEPYAIAKIAGIKMCQSYNRQYGTCYIPVMPTNLYGPGDNFDPESSHVLAALIKKFYDSMKKEVMSRPVPSPRSGGRETGGRSGEVVVWGTGKPRREFLHVDDLADACCFLMENYDGSEIINIGTGRDISIAELAELIGEIVGFQGDIRFDSSRPDGTPRKLLDLGRIRELGWFPGIVLREGIRDTYEWYARHMGDTDPLKRP